MSQIIIHRLLDSWLKRTVHPLVSPKGSYWPSLSSNGLIVITNVPKNIRMASKYHQYIVINPNIPTYNYYRYIAATIFNGIIGHMNISQYSFPNISIYPIFICQYINATNNPNVHIPISIKFIWFPKMGLPNSRIVMNSAPIISDWALMIINHQY